MENDVTGYVGVDVHKESIAVRQRRRAGRRRGLWEPPVRV
jgi:chloramphenicol 3-O-phosphotransferase